jgi:hypothetical protein
MRLALWLLLLLFLASCLGLGCGCGKDTAPIQTKVPSASERDKMPKRERPRR